MLLLHVDKFTVLPQASVSLWILHLWPMPLQIYPLHWSEWPSSKKLLAINAGEDLEKKEPFYTVAGDVNWYSHDGEWFLKELKIKLTYDPAIQLLEIYPEKTIIPK